MKNFLKTVALLLTVISSAVTTWQALGLGESKPARPAGQPTIRVEAVTRQVIRRDACGRAIVVEEVSCRPVQARSSRACR